MSDEWKIDRRRPGCVVCARAFGSEETHVSGIMEIEGHFVRRDYCTACWEKRTEELFSFWITVAPKREQRTLEDINAMQDFFRKLVEKPAEDPLREKIVYLTALLLMRKKRLKAAGSRQRDGRPRLVLEKSWDGETIEIADPPIADDELERLKAEMEALFQTESTVQQGA
jgi:hypothetical protein